MSTDSVEENTAFVSKYKFPFPLLSDTEHQMCLAYGTCTGERTERITYLIGPDRKIAHVYMDIEDFSGHADTILKLVKSSSSEKGVISRSDIARVDISEMPPAMSHVKQVEPAGCGQSPKLGYVLGTVGYDFGTEARLDSFVQAGLQHPNILSEFLTYLDEAPYEASRVIWTLNIDATPVYAIQPVSPFVEATYERLRKFLNAQLTEGVERVSISGFIGGSATLMSGQTVPIIVPVLHGLCSWSTSTLVKAVLGDTPSSEAQEQYAQRQAGVHNFLERVYYELRNLGVTSQERAINFAATNALQVEQVFEQSIQHELNLQGIEVEKSPICRPNSDCWDVKLTFFDPENRLGRARKVYRFTIDVRDVIPVTVGTVRSFNVYED